MNTINQLLEENSLTHYQYYEEQNRIVYVRESGTFMHTSDFVRLIDVLNDNSISHYDLGPDVIMLEELN
jgi:hypothetical protein